MIQYRLQFSSVVEVSAIVVTAQLVKMRRSTLKTSLHSVSKMVFRVQRFAQILMTSREIAKERPQSVITF